MHLWREQKDYSLFHYNFLESYKRDLGGAICGIAACNYPAQIWTNPAAISRLPNVGHEHTFIKMDNATEWLPIFIIVSLKGIY